MASLCSCTHGLAGQPVSSLNDTLFFLHPDFCLTHFRQRQASKGSVIRKRTCSPLLWEAWTSRPPPPHMPLQAGHLLPKGHPVQASQPAAAPLPGRRPLPPRCPPPRRGGNQPALEPGAPAHLAPAAHLLTPHMTPPPTPPRIRSTRQPRSSRAHLSQRRSTTQHRGGHLGDGLVPL